MRAVQWDYQSFTDQVNDILIKWPDLHPEHLMELLTSHFLNPIVRKFAVKKLNMARDDVFSEIGSLYYFKCFFVSRNCFSISFNWSKHCAMTYLRIFLVLNQAVKSSLWIKPILLLILKHHLII